MSLKQIHDGEWVSPVHRGYVLACCDCGLRHRMDFRATKKGVQFRATRLTRKTMAAKKWIQASGVAQNKGGLHRATGTPSDEPISAFKLAQALHSKSPHVRKMAQFAKAMKSIKRKKK